MKDLVVQILENKQVSASFFLLKFKYPDPVKPGQFFNIKIDKSNDPFLRRPLSVHAWDKKNKEITLLYKVVGQGTRVLSNKKKGAELKVLGPLGNSFELKGLTAKTKVALLGGGIGLAPLLFLAKELAEKKVKMTVFMGFKTKQDIYIDPELKKICKDVVLATDDGSAGKCGFVTSCFAEELKKQKYKQVFVCGPDLMMKIAQAICKKADIAAQFSLESIMGCGIGACMCCVCDTVKGYKKVCSDGPVFKGEEIKW